MKSTTIGIAALTLLAGSVSGQSYSLDDNPNMPLTSPPFAGLYSAEDPFGLFLPSVFFGLIGPSPSLLPAAGVAYVDGDVLKPVGPFPMSPNMDIPAPTGPYLDAVTADHEEFHPDDYQEIQLRFSPDRATDGIAGSDLALEFGFSQQPGDVYFTEMFFQHPGFFVGTLGPGPFAGLLPTAMPGMAIPNLLEFDESVLNLTAGLGPGVFIPPFVQAPQIFPGSHDNVDAFNILPAPEFDLDGDFVTDFDMYTSIQPASAFVSGVSAADIFAVAKGLPGGFLVPWAPAPSMGLDLLGSPPNPQLELLMDDIDALVVWDNGDLIVDPDGLVVSRAEPIEDYALFSLSPGSASLTAIRNMPGAALPVDASTVFFTDFTGAFAVYAFGEQLGVRSIFFGQNEFEPNIDALEILPGDPPCPCVRFLADVNLNGVLEPTDFGAWLAAYNSGDCRADQNRDGAITPTDFGAWLFNYNNGVLCP